MVHPAIELSQVVGHRRQFGEERVEFLELLANAFIFTVAVVRLVSAMKRSEPLGQSTAPPLHAAAVQLSAPPALASAILAV